MLGLFASNIEDFLGSRFVRSGLLFYRGSVSIFYIFRGFAKFAECLKNNI